MDIKLLLGLLQLFKSHHKIQKYYNQKRLEYFTREFKKEILAEANLEFKISKYWDLESAFNQSAFRGMINSLFLPDRYYYTPLDLALAINISINGYCNESTTDNAKIIDASYHIMDKIRELILVDGFIKELLSDVGKSLGNYRIEYPRKEIEEVLKDKKQIFKRYFHTFHDDRFSSKVKIWHQGYGKSWIEWKDEDSLEVNVDPTKVREGFFIPFFDYDVNGEGLQKATIRKGYVYADKDIEGELAWLR